MDIINSFINSLKSIFPSKVSLGNRVGRFLTSKSSHFSVKNRIVKPAAFMPMFNKKKSRFETSVFQIDGLSTDEVEKIGVKEIKVKTGRNVYGYARISINSIEAADLEVNPDNKPPRHATICNWPDLKAKQKLCALKLSQASRLATF